VARIRRELLEAADELSQRHRVMKRIIAEERPTLLGYNETLYGERLFHETGCASCHVPQLMTGLSDWVQLGQTGLHPILAAGIAHLELTYGNAVCDVYA
jgi:hypothetical protein